jgi:hypothetical protein
MPDAAQSEPWRIDTSRNLVSVRRQTGRRQQVWSAGSCRRESSATFTCVNVGRQFGHEALKTRIVKDGFLLAVSGIFL